MKIKVTPFRVILGLNLLVIAMIYTSRDHNGAGWDVLVWAMLTLAQVVVNLVLLAVTGLLMLVPAWMEKLKNVTAGFAISAGLVLLISFPLCFALSAIRH